MRNRSWRGARSGAGAPTFREHVDFDPGVAMTELGPALFRLSKHVESADRRCLQEIVDTVTRQDNVNILSYAAEVSVPPNCPATTHDRFAITRVKHLVQSLHDTAVPIWQILSLEHSIPPSHQEIGQLKSRV